MPLLCSGCTENSSKIGRLPCLQRMPLLSRVTMQKGAKDGGECHPQCSLEKQTSASFTFAERAPQLHNSFLAAGLGGKSTTEVLGQPLCFSCLHILCCPFRSRSSSSEQKPCECLELVPLFHLDTKSLKPKTFHLIIDLFLLNASV